MTITTLDSQAAQDNWNGLLDTVASSDESIVITLQSEPVAVLVDYSTFLAIEERLNVLRAGRPADAGPVIAD